ncbi:hypothetical protein GW17_00054966 [Ensete ventricosum]|nr:hypothetical protein GW17_00054966 [Ensete ventricosum]
MSSFDRFFVHHLGNSNTGHSQRISPWEVVRARFHKKIRWLSTLHKVTRKVEFRYVSYAPWRKFKILAIPNVLTHAKSYEHSFTKKHDDHKFYAKSSFDWFFVHCLDN